MDVLHNDFIPMVVSLLLGPLVGLERQMGRKPAGLRTHVLVGLGGPMFWFPTSKRGRGFGGGVAVGVRAYPLAVIGAVMALIVLEGYRWLERMTDRDDSSGE